MAIETKTMSAAGSAMAVCVVTAWLAMLAWLAFSVDMDDRGWARMVGLLASIEAVAFAAAGALLGITVQRGSVADAKARAEKAEQVAQANVGAAAAGRTLAKAVQASVDAAVGVDPADRLQGIRRLGDDAVGGDGHSLAELRRLAQALFPD
jgi:hypothetical protein